MQRINTRRAFDIFLQFLELSFFQVPVRLNMKYFLCDADCSSVLLPLPRTDWSVDNQLPGHTLGFTHCHLNLSWYRYYQMPCCRWPQVWTRVWFLLINTSVFQTMGLSWQTSLRSKDCRKVVPRDLCFQHFLFFFPSPPLFSSPLFLSLSQPMAYRTPLFQAGFLLFSFFWKHGPPYPQQSLCPCSPGPHQDPS